MRIIVIFLLALFLNFGSSEKCKKNLSKSWVRRIKQYIFCNYDSDEQPPNDNGNGTNLMFGMIPRVANFDETTDNFEITSLIYASWNDKRLSWNAISFNNTKKLFVPIWMLWGPDIAVHSRGGGKIQEKGNLDSHCHLYWEEGTVTCIPTMTYTTRCQTDFTLWPYDRQNCTLVLGSWSYTGNEIAFKTKMRPPVYMDYFMSNGEWRITVSRASFDKKQSHYFKNMTTPILSIDFILDRVHNQMSIVYVTPAAILMIMTLTTLWLDPRSIERLSVACLNPLIHLLCIQNLHWALPHNGTAVPRILLFYIDSFILAITALVLTFVLRNIESIKKSPPKWIVATTGLILRSKIGQILLLGMLDPKASAGIDYDADDSGELVFNTVKEQRAWDYVTIFIGWITFIGFFIAYVIMYGFFMPNSSMKAPLEALELGYV